MKKAKVLVAVPCMEYIHYLTSMSLDGLPRVSNAEVHKRYKSGSLVYISRNAFCEEAVNGGFTHLLFIDSDMVFPPSTLNRLLKHDKDIATAVCYARLGNYEPQVYTEMKPATETESFHYVRAENVDGVFPIEACGMAVCLIKTDLIRKMLEDNVSPFEPFGCLGEDFSFCVRAKEYGAEIIADGTFPIGHVGNAIFTKEDWVKDVETD